MDTLACEPSLLELDDGSQETKLHYPTHKGSGITLDDQ